MKVPKLIRSVRFSLAALNCLFLITGFILLIAGIVVLNAFNVYDVILTQRFFTLSNFAIATAAIIFVTSLLGFYGAISEQFYVIAGYVALLVVVLIFEISITILGFRLQNTASNDIRRPMANSISLYGLQNIPVSMFWDNLQTDFQCCGVDAETNWGSGVLLPVSCCRIAPGTVSPFVCTADDANNRGCLAPLGQWLGYNAYAVGVAAAFVTSLQVLIVGAAAWLTYRSKFEEVELER